MDYSSLPFYQQLGIEPCTNPSHGLLEIPKERLALNHVESVQTSAIFALAEACSSVYLARSLEQSGISGYLPSIRNSQIKFRSTASERIYGVGKPKSELWDKLEANYAKSGKGIIAFPIFVMTETGKCVAVSTFDWYIFRIPQRARRC
jgi:acyl-coenzyme A thioesterase PaaI-like protein